MNTVKIIFESQPISPANGIGFQERTEFIAAVDLHGSGDRAKGFVLYVVAADDPEVIAAMLTHLDDDAGFLSILKNLADAHDKWTGNVPFEDCVTVRIDEGKLLSEDP